MPDLIVFSMIFCICKFIFSCSAKFKDTPIKSFWGFVDFALAVCIIVFTATLFYHSRKYLPGHLADPSIEENSNPGLEFVRVFIWQLYLLTSE